MSKDGGEVALRAMARRQFGTFSHDQVKACGLSASMITRRVRDGEWERIHPGVYRIAGTPVTFEQRMLAATMWAGEPSVVSHRTAAHLWELTGVHTRRVEIWTPNPTRHRAPSVTVHRTLRLEEDDRAFVRGVPVTSPARTLIDLAGLLPLEAVLASADEFFRRGLLSIEVMWCQLDRLASRGRRGSVRLQRAIGHRLQSPAQESRLETRVLGALLASDLPQPVAQHEFVVAGHRYRLDFAWPKSLVAVECDGFSAHGGWEAFHRDRTRLARVAAAGWRVIPVTWRRITTDSEGVIADLRAALQPLDRG